MDVIPPSDLQQRLTYLNRVIPFIWKDIIKVFTGQRRVGKSYLLFQIIQYLQQQNKNVAILYINKEDLAFSDIKTANDLQDYVLTHQSKKQKTYLFIDEIQEIIDFEDALRSLLLNKDIDIYCTWSNADLLSIDISGRCSGRFI